MQTFPDEIAPALARWLAPYVAAELAKQPATMQPPSSRAYDEATCAEYVKELGGGVLNRATDFFMKLEANGRIGSVELAETLGIMTPRNIPSNLTNSLKQRAKSMGLERPWDESTSEDDRTVWVDRDGIAARMLEALRAENQRRFGPTR